MKKGLLIIGGILGFILQLFVSIQVLLDIDYIYTNYVQSWLAPEGTMRDLELEYVGMQKVDLSQSDFYGSLNRDEYTTVWDVSSYRWGYKYLNEEIGFNNSEIAFQCMFLGGTYIVSYGRKLTNATFDPKIYRGLFFNNAPDISEYDSGGYYVDYTFDETEYTKDVVYIYKYNGVPIGNADY